MSQTESIFFVERTKEEGREIILIVDESHYHYWSNQSQELVQSVIHLNSF